MEKKGWIRIVEAFVAILLVAGVVLVVLNKGYLGKEDISSQIYEEEHSILTQIQLDNALRDAVIASDPVEWEGAGFPENIKTHITEKTPGYLVCVAKICYTDQPCGLNTPPEKDIYAESVIITANLETFSPKVLKLFCWMR